LHFKQFAGPLYDYQCSKAHRGGKSNFIRRAFGCAAANCSPIMIHAIKSLDRVLKGQATDLASLRRGNIDISARGLSLLLAVLGAIYGVCMGVFALVTRWGMGQPSAGFLQMSYSAAKVPMLFLLTLAVTLPSLYVFNALVGCRLLFSAVVRLLVAALGVTLAVLASFGTIIAFFSLCTTSYPFMVLLNVLTFALAGVLGMTFLLKTLQRLSVAEGMASPTAEPTPIPQPSDLPTGEYAPASPPRASGALDRLQGQGIGAQVRAVFVIWVIVFSLVGAQMGWILRPFIGAPDVPVTFFRPRQSNFFEGVADKLADLATGHNPTTRPWNYR